MSVVVGLLIFLIQVFLVLVLIRVVFSWVSPVPTNPVSRLAWRLTEPVLGPVRRRLPLMSGIDFSPLVVWLIAIILISALRTVGQ